jgi:hypothetical protein
MALQRMKGRDPKGYIAEKYVCGKPKSDHNLTAKEEY